MGQRRQIIGLRALITGASQGIGRALALEAARRGAQVLAAARSQTLLSDLEREASQRGHALFSVAADVTSPEDRRRMIEAARTHLGGLDVLINNAGIGASGHFADAGPERLRRIFEVNFFGTAEMIRACLPLLQEGKTPAILNVSSIAGRVGIPARSEYSASKFAVQGFSEALRAELARYGIDVLLVNPGVAQTNFVKNMLEAKAKVELDHTRGMTPEQVAELTLDALAKGQREVTLSAKGRLLVAVSRLFPWLVDMVTRKKVRELYRDEIAARVQRQNQSVEVSLRAPEARHQVEPACSGRGAPRLSAGTRSRRPTARCCESSGPAQLKGSAFGRESSWSSLGTLIPRISWKNTSNHNPPIRPASRAAFAD